MCGHCGVLGPGINSWDLSVVKDLLTVSTLRGEDGTGVLQGKAENWFGVQRIDYVIEKMAAQALYYKWYHARAKEGNRRILSNISDNFVCCHVRAATKGYVTDDNAHPFEFEKLVGMHNGTLRDKKYEDKDKTDSELMFKDMDERGIIPVLEQLDPWSAYACVIFSKEDGTISFVRNDQRTLYYSVHETRAVMYWASEIWMLKEMAARNTEKLYKDKDGNDVFYFKPNILYTLHPQELKAKDAFPFTTKSFKPRSFPNMRGKGGARFQQQEQLFLPNPREVSNQNQKKVQTVNLMPISGKPRFNSKTKIPVVHCCACQKEMKLIDVFYATKLNSSGTTVVCQDCDDGFKTDFNTNINTNKEVIIN